MPFQWTLAAALGLCLAATFVAGDDSVMQVPKCPFPCGDNDALLCSQHEIVKQGGNVSMELPVGLTVEDGWDIRVHNDDQGPSGSKFKVMILDAPNFLKYKLKKPYVWCEGHELLNKPISCMSLQGRFCRQAIAVGATAPTNYTKVVIECDATNPTTCALFYNVEAVWMPDSPCYSLGLPCGYWTALLWLLILGTLGALSYVFREKLVEVGGPLVMSAGAALQIDKWRVFSGRRNGVEEMESRLAQGTEGADENYARM
mmetsp:Transcript_31446/g.74744  ORF Transcript_31446/g.74744 Transcript_31446/m.74744 type:complete len:258 (-) Transcript_31446:223-996(-)